MGLAGILSMLPSAGRAQGIGSCETGSAVEYLDVNGVSASIYNAGGLFYKGAAPRYNVPLSTDGNSIFAAGLWIGGKVGGEVRFAGSDYHSWEFWPGPVDDAHNPPSDCSEFDRIFKVSRRDIRQMDETGVATDDIRDWPWRLGAPVDDGDGDPGNYNLAGGDRPAILGDQSLWWVMNDVAGPHERFGMNPLGVEVRAMAFAVSSPTDQVNNTTFYRYEVINRSPSVIEDAWFGMFVDADLGDASDDYVGSDSVLGLAYTWNGDDFDGGADGYGDRPPAIGVALIDSLHVDGRKLGMTNASFFIGDATIDGNPNDGVEAYGYLQSRWRDGSLMTVGGSGRGFSETPTRFMFPARPPEFWSEENTDGNDARNTPSDRRFVWSSGPFTLTPEQTAEIVLAVVWAQGDDRFDSVYRLIDAVPTVRQAYSDGFPDPVSVRPGNPPDLISPGADAGSQPTHLTLLFGDVDQSDGYEIEIADDDSIVISEQVRIRDIPGSASPDELTFDAVLERDARYAWRVRGLSAAGYGPWSESRRFTTGQLDMTSPGALPIVPGGSEPAFIQIAGIGNDDACGPAAGSRFGCDEVGGNGVFESLNGQENWTMFSTFGSASIFIGSFAPNDFEIRATDQGSYGLYPWEPDGRAIWVPFEAWDIGDVGPFGINDESDDVQLVALLDYHTAIRCGFRFGDRYQDPLGSGWPTTDEITAVYPTESYAAFEAFVGPLVESDPDGCPKSPSTDPAADLVDFDGGAPLSSLVFAMDPADPAYREEMIPAGNVIRFLTDRLEPAQPSAPSSGAIVSSEVTLYWQAPPYVQESRVQVARTSEFEAPLVNETTTGRELDLRGLSDGVHYWRILHEGAAWSEIWTFNVVPGTSSEDDGLGLPTELELKPTYPNPSSGPRTLVFGVPQTQRISLEVFDLLGRRVESISDGERTAGWHSERWDPKGLSAGVYFVRLASDDQRRTQPVVVTK